MKFICEEKILRYLLEQIQNYLGLGRLYKHGPQSIEFCVLNQKDLSVVISHFDNYPFHTQKRADYELELFNLRFAGGGRPDKKEKFNNWLFRLCI